MQCGSCHEENFEDARECGYCGARLYDYPWHVWWRYMRQNDTPLTAWHDEPKKYRTESAARMAESDLNREYNWPHGRVQHVALPRGVFPWELFL